MSTTRILLALLVFGAAACSGDTTRAEPTHTSLMDGSPIMGTGNKDDTTSTGGSGTNPDSTTTQSGS